MGKIGLPFIDSDLLYRGSTVLVFIKQDKNDMKFPPPPPPPPQISQWQYWSDKEKITKNTYVGCS